MPDKGKFDLGDYVEVKDRIRVFYESYGNGRLVTERVELTKEPDDKPKVIVYATAYRTPDDPHPGTGTSWMYLPGTTSYTRGSEIENAETSAWGRAIGSLGILIDRSIATSTEIDAKAGDPAPAIPNPSKAMTRADEPELVGPWSGTGVIGVNKKGTADGFMRQSPDDGGVFIVTFTTTDEHKVSQVVFRGSLALDVYDAGAGNLNGMPATIEGTLYRVPYYVGEQKIRREFERLEVERIRTAGWTLPVAEAASLPLFSEADDAELDRLLA